MPGAALNIPTVVQVPSGVADRLRETSAKIKREARHFLRA